MNKGTCRGSLVATTEDFAAGHHFRLENSERSKVRREIGESNVIYLGSSKLVGPLHAVIVPCAAGVDYGVPLPCKTSFLQNDSDSWHRIQIFSPAVANALGRLAASASASFK